ncbi:hypothetical protein SEA_TANIS_6 [Gordonia phage Tanis]|uniref:Uncharacterized protein n=1 Tax=Gordonia phage Tanis TaxID=2652415 RepID=A0A5P8DBT0_9CAUD|nr:hypothetical protein HWC73_gp06 [Gordonia phage Tanis]QFP95580.1 hypothetical protein SEA_TANIS_6 [Gordonia phage Tanis]
MTFLQGIVDAKPKLLRMHKAPGDLGGVGNSYRIVENMMSSPESEDPAAFINDALVVNYDAEPYQALIYGQIQWTGGSMPQVNCRIRRNGSDLVTGGTTTNSSSYAYASTTQMVYPGESFELWWRGEGSFLVRPTLKAGVNTFLQIEPM